MMMGQLLKRRAELKQESPPFLVYYLNIKILGCEGWWTYIKNAGNDFLVTPILEVSSHSLPPLLLFASTAILYCYIIIPSISIQSSVCLLYSVHLHHITASSC
jgi:hypothetical protein